MRAGDAFYLPDQSADGHLWVIISDPEKIQRIRRGLSLSRRIDFEHAELMCEHDLLD